MKESSEKKKARKKVPPQEEVTAKEKVEGQSSPGSLLPPEAAAARGAPSFNLAHCPPATHSARTTPVHSHPPPVSSPGDQVSLCQETTHPFGLRWKTTPPSFPDIGKRCQESIHPCGRLSSSVGAPVPPSQGLHRLRACCGSAILHLTAVG